MAIVNEDPSMVRFLLDNGVNCLEACNGNFFTPEDQESIDKFIAFFGTRGMLRG